MSPHWYDLLDVDRTASSERIRSAWKSSIADLDPSDRRFRVLNEAAEILLDPDRRAAYDATLAEEEVEEEQVEGEPEQETVGALPATHEPAGRQGNRIALVALLAVVAIAVVCVTIFAWTRPGPIDEGPALAAAEAAVFPVLSYDYRTLDEDAEAAKSYMTRDFAKSYDETFTLLQENAARTKTVVRVDNVVANSVVRSSEGRVDVLLFVNRSRSNAAQEDTFRDQVTMQMRLVDGTWLLDGLVTTPAAA
ncbi:hypothetical protein NPS01_23510 [Nocardioides psychrotolerans]|uniref:Mce-associated membrane protein n=1 Tax=Nocardioides psychrotolerans TaxID=1005945 RepID=A0A1I3HY27_9ACTN|nr:DnaJ domain-containing protein [Nocardioides psychrotolerans]GEP38688.1 hypothetical protein NPS01_23510 [Nocardioides psychrotolerans]SFI40513.1 Mce-associated membrane protein [Nocardioides psychrotolerans]